MSDIKYIDIAEFHSLGFIQEINRRVLHPCGLALSVEVDENGTATGFAGIWDDRDDPEGIYFGPAYGPDPVKAANVDALIEQHRERRQSKLGYVVQPAVPTEPASVQGSAKLPQNPAAVPDDLLYDAWVLIANASNWIGGGQPTPWTDAAIRWRDKWHATLRAAAAVPTEDAAMSESFGHNPDDVGDVLEHGTDDEAAK